MKFENGDVITLDDDTEYVVIDKITCEEKQYVILATNIKPLKMIVCRIEDEKLIEIEDKKLIRKIISEM